MNERLSARLERNAAARQGVQRHRDVRPGWLRPALLLLCALPVASAAATGLALALAGTQQPQVSAVGPASVVEVVVGPGDSLWSIARRHLPVEADLRAGVDEIMRLNDMSGCVVRPGEVLLVPALRPGAGPGDGAARGALARRAAEARDGARDGAAGSAGVL